MNAKNAHDFIPLLQALGDGKIIQEDYFGEWSDLSDEISFSMKPKFYRIKPEPRTFKLYIIDTANGETVMTTHPTFDSRWKTITVQEVLK
jgi:hypothetical protein